MRAVSRWPTALMLKFCTPCKAIRTSTEISNRTTIRRIAAVVPRSASQGKLASELITLIA